MKNSFTSTILRKEKTALATWPDTFEEQKEDNAALLSRFSANLIMFSGIVASMELVEKCDTSVSLLNCSD